MRRRHDSELLLRSAPTTNAMRLTIYYAVVKTSRGRENARVLHIGAVQQYSHSASDANPAMSGEGGGVLSKRGIVHADGGQCSNLLMVRKGRDTARWTHGIAY